MKHITAISVLILVASSLFAISCGSVLKITSEIDFNYGNCSNASYESRVYQDHIVKTAWPLIIRSEEINYRGDFKIFCIQLQNLLGNETSFLKIDDGGVGHTYVDIDIESYRGYGLDWNVTIYADKTKVISPAVLLQSVHNIKNIV